jgi:hypothetical protein
VRVHGVRGLRMLELPAESGRALEALRQARSAYLAVIAAHERVAGLLVVLGDPDTPVSNGRRRRGSGHGWHGWTHGW